MLDSLLRDSNVVRRELRNSVPFARRHNSGGTQTLTTATDTTITLGSIGLDNWGMTSTANTITIKVPGVYLIGGAVGYAASANGALRDCKPLINGSTFAALTRVSPCVEHDGSPTAACFVSATGIREMQAGDTIVLQGRHDHGSDLSTAALGSSVPLLWALFLAQT